MKIVFILFIATFSLVAQDLRLVGTNLFDFSKAGHGIYYLGGFQIKKTYPKSIQVQRTRVYQKFVPDMSRLSKDLSSDLESSLAFGQPNYYGKWENPYSDLINKKWQIQSRIASSPNLTKAKADEFGIPGQDVQITTNITLYILNHPGGSPIDYCAVPTSIPNFWDHGVSFNGDVGQYECVYHVLPDQIILKHQKKTNVQSEANQKLLAQDSAHLTNIFLETPALHTNYLLQVKTSADQRNKSN